MTWQNLAQLGGGLGLFLFGMKMMGDELERAAGNKLRHWLELLTKNRFFGLLLGMVFTMLVQSSSATTVMVVGFVNAGLMNIFQAAGVILGANIGTTITAQLIALKLNDVAPIFLLIGVVMLTFFKRNTIRQTGGIIAGFGILFVGLSIMGDSMAPLKTMPEVSQLMSQFSNPFLGVLIGMAVTAVIQSSSASVGILQVIAAQGAIGLDAAVYVVLGQNIGTCVTALLAAIGGNKNAVRTALLHLSFKLIGAALFMVLLWLFPIVDWIKAAWPDNPMQQIASFHIAFNLVNTVALFPFSNHIVRLVYKILPGEDPIKEDMRLQYLSESILATPPAAVMQIIREISRMLKLAADNVGKSLDAFLHLGASKMMEEIEHVEDVLNYLSKEITRYLVMVNQSELSDREAFLVAELYHVINDIERIGDHAENILELAQDRENNKIALSDMAVEELTEMFQVVNEMLSIAYTGFDTHDQTRVPRAYALEERVDEMEDTLRIRHIERLNNNQCTPKSGMLFTDVIMNLERVADHTINIIVSEDKV